MGNIYLAMHDIIEQNVENKLMTIAANKIVYLFSSAYHPVYKQDNINALCYPTGFIMHFRYEEKWVDTEILNENPEELVGKEAIIVVVEAEKRNQERLPLFFPIRKAKIKKFDIDGSVSHVYFELLPDWVDYRENNKLRDYQSCIESVKEKPISGNEMLIGKFFSLDNLQQDINFSSEAKAWESIIEKIGNLDSYKETLFYRLSRFYEAKSNRDLEIIKFDELRCGYTLKSGTKYNFELSFSYGKKPPEAASKDRLIVKVDLDKNFYTPIPDEIPLGFRVDKQNVYLSTKELFLDAFTYLVISFKKDLIEGPSILIPIEIKKTVKTYFYVLMILIGLILVTGIISERIPILSTYKDGLALLGTVITTTGTWLLSGFRGS